MWPSSYSHLWAPGVTQALTQGECRECVFPPCFLHLLRDGGAKSYCWLLSSLHSGVSFLFVSFWGVLGVLPDLAAVLFPAWQGPLPSGILQTAASSKPGMVLDQPQWSSLRESSSPRMAGLPRGEGEGEKIFSSCLQKIVDILCGHLPRWSFLCI